MRSPRLPIGTPFSTHPSYSYSANNLLPPTPRAGAGRQRRVHANPLWGEGDTPYGREVVPASMRRRRIRTDGTSSRPFRPRPAVAFRVVRSVRFLGSVIIVPPCRCCIGPGSGPETAPSPCLILLAVRYGRGAIDPASRVAGSMTVRGSRPHTRSNVTIGSPPGPRSSTSKAPTPARMRVECHLGPAWYRLPSNRDRAGAVRFHAHYVPH